MKVFEIDDVIFKIELCEGKDLIKFWERNSHLLSEENKDKNIKNKKNIKIKPRKLKEPIYLGEEKYDDFNEIKNKIEKITENKTLNEKDIKFIKDLIKYHPDKNIIEKVNESDSIMTEKNGEGNEYNKDGKLIFKGQYLRGLRWNGNGNVYDLEGNIKYEVNYFSGVPIRKSNATTLKLTRNNS